MEGPGNLRERIEAAFVAIARTRMAGMPVMNPMLEVSMRELRTYGEHHVGVLVTPWFMNLLFVPLVQPEKGGRVGTVRTIVLPSGHYETMLCHEDALGWYWSASLFSPMWDFGEMAGAIATADTAFELVFASADGRPGEPGEGREEFFEAMVQPAPRRSVEERLAEAEAAELARSEPAAAEESAEVKPEPPREALDRRALFGLSRRKDREAA